MAIEFRRQLLLLVPRSGWTAFAILAVSTIAFEALTRPWSHAAAISPPYTMLYGIGTALLCLYGPWPGVLGSMTWFWGVILWQGLHNDNWPDLQDHEVVRDQAIRLVLQWVVPWIAGWLVVGKRLAEQKERLEC